MSRQFAKDYYRQVAPEYDEIRGDLFYYCERHTVLEHLPEIAGRSVLDVACGTGLYTRLFETLGASDVTGLESLQKCSSKLALSSRGALLII